MDPVRKATWQIESFLNDVDLHRLAEVTGVSRYHLTRAFGVATGRSIMKYVRHRRLTEAAKRLAAGEQDILCLAIETAYGSHEAFTRAFSEQFGLTPEGNRKNKPDHRHLVKVAQ